MVEKLREEESGVYGVGARGSMEKYPYGSYNFTISFPCGPENVDKLKSAALKELQSIIDNGPTQKDVDKIIEAQLLEYKENLKKNKFWMDFLNNSDYDKKDRSGILNVAKKTKAITTKDIQAVAKKYLNQGYIYAVLYPEDKK